MKKKQLPQDQVDQEPQAPNPATTKQGEESPKPQPAPVAAQEQAQALEKVQAALAEAHDKYVRLYAEFENFRRRATKEKIALIETASEAILTKLLPIMDDFERALAAASQNSAPQAMQKGVRLIYDKLIHLCQQAGVQPMETTQGTPFDAELHEAVTQTPVADKALQGKVVEVVEKGYYLRNKVLRFAKVVIGS